MPSERSSLIRALFDEYIALYARRDERLLQRFSHDFSGYVGSSEGFVRDREAWLRLLKDDFAQFPGFVAVEVLDCAVQELSQDICLLTARCRIRLPMPDQVVWVIAVLIADHTRQRLHIAGIVLALPPHGLWPQHEQ